MKEILSLLVVMLCAITTYAQAPFTTYKPVQPSNNYSNGNSGNYQSTDPFTYYRPLEPSRNYQPAPQAQSKTYNLTGYYYDTNGWHKIPIKVTVTEEKWVLSAYKDGNNWISNSGVVSKVGYYDSDIVKENFNYKARTLRETIYF